MAASTTEPLDRIALVFNQLGRGAWRAGSLTAIGLALAHRRRWRCLAAFLTAEAATPVAINAVKLVFVRERPAGARIDAFGTSFPSGHAAYAGATTVALVLLCSDPGRHRRHLWASAAAGTTAMAVSRTYLQAHWLTDVTAGALVGAGVSLATFAGFNRGRPRRRST
jgi:membrane-associated phospholipid phosphatase